MFSNVDLKRVVVFDTWRFGLKYPFLRYKIGLQFNFLKIIKLGLV